MSVVELDVALVAAGAALLDDPPRTIHVNIFGIARAPVSNRDYAAFVASTAHPAPPCDGRPAWRRLSRRALDNRPMRGRATLAAGGVAPGDTRRASAPSRPVHRACRERRAGVASSEERIARRYARPAAESDAA